VAQYCPEHFDGNKYNWREYSEYIAKYCLEYFDPELYNIEDDYWARQELLKHPNLIKKLPKKKLLRFWELVQEGKK